MSGDSQIHPDLRIVYNLAYGVLAGEAGRFSLVGDYTIMELLQKTPRVAGVFVLRVRQSMCPRHFRFDASTTGWENRPNCPIVQRLMAEHVVQRKNCATHS